MVRAPRTLAILGLLLCAAWAIDSEVSELDAKEEVPSVSQQNSAGRYSSSEALHEHYKRTAFAAHKVKQALQQRQALEQANEASKLNSQIPKLTQELHAAEKARDAAKAALKPRERAGRQNKVDPPIATAAAQPKDEQEVQATNEKRKGALRSKKASKGTKKAKLAAISAKLQEIEAKGGESQKVAPEASTAPEAEEESEASEGTKKAKLAVISEKLREIEGKGEESQKVAPEASTTSKAEGQSETSPKPEADKTDQAPKGTAPKADSEMDLVLAQAMNLKQAARRYIEAGNAYGQKAKQMRKKAARKRMKETAVAVLEAKQRMEKKKLREEDTKNAKLRKRFEEANKAQERARKAFKQGEAANWEMKPVPENNAEPSSTAPVTSTNETQQKEKEEEEEEEEEETDKKVISQQKDHTKKTPEFEQREDMSEKEVNYWVNKDMPVLQDNRRSGSREISTMMKIKRAEAKELSRLDSLAKGQGEQSLDETGSEADDLEAGGPALSTDVVESQLKSLKERTEEKIADARDAVGKNPLSDPKNPTLDAPPLPVD